MATHDSRLNALETKFDTRSAARDKSDAETRESLIEVASTAGQALAAVTKLADQFAEAATKPVPGALQFWGPAVSTAVAIALGFTWVLSATVGPIIERMELHQDSNNRVFEEISKANTLSNQRQWDMNGTIQYEKGKASGMQNDIARLYLMVDKLKPKE